MNEFNKFTFNKFNKFNEFYVEQSKATSPEDYQYLYDDLSDDLVVLCENIRGLFLHFSEQDDFNYKIPPHRYHETNNRYVKNILQQIHSYDKRSLTQPREIAHRMIAVCRDYSILLCSILRHKNVPARLRIGFSNFLTPGFYLDWICVEYWNKYNKKWTCMDSRITSYHLKKFKIKLDFSLLDIPEDRFISAAQAWQLCRSGSVNPNRFGSAHFRGLWYVRLFIARISFIE